MKVLENNGESLVCELSHDEVLMLMAGMREICYGVDFHAFETRIGFSREQVGLLVKQFRALVDEQGIDE